MRAIEARGIDLVLDVGANEGQYVSWLRKAGYAGRVHSFEPIPSAFESMRSHLLNDPLWTGHNSAVGASAGMATLNVAKSTLLSSLLPASAELQRHIPAAAKAATIDVSVVSLDMEWDRLVPDEAHVMLKIDTQGFEHQVLDGTDQHLARVQLLEVEMSLVQLYDGGSSIHDVLPRLHATGFDVISIDTGFVDGASGQVLDIDVLVGRR